MTTSQFTGPASAVEKGDAVTYCGTTFEVAKVEQDPSGLLKFSVTGAMPQYVAAEREVTIRRVHQPEKPYVVYTRDYDADGNCDKRVFRFRTEGQRSAFLRRTNRCVTFTN